MESATLDLVSFRVSIRRLSDLVMCLPMLGIIACFGSALVLHDDITTTRCQVYNAVPSVSAITGVSPERYLWRLCMALHIIPRLLLAAVCREELLRAVDAVAAPLRCSYRRLVRAAYWANMAELAALAGVTYVSNKENYPLHEKLFSVFLLACGSYMLLSLAVERVSGPRPLARHRQLTALLYLAAVLGLLFYFWKHRAYCQELAYTWFAVCEYGICACIMAFHVLVVRDLPDLWLAVGRIRPVAANGTAAKAE